MDRYKALPPEDIKLGTWYSFSYNPKDQPRLAPLTFTKVFQEPFSTWFKEEISNIFSNHLRYCTIEYRLEISKGGRFHVHGRILIKDIVLFYAVDLQRLKVHGTYEIDYLNDETVWNNYCTKQSSFMEDFCKKENIPYLNNSDKTPKSLQEYQTNLLTRIK